MANQEHLAILRRGATIWNRWRQRNPGVKPDLKEADLSGENLSRANLSGANLSGANLSGANLSGANLSGADLSRADLSRADLSRADLSRADLSRANFSGINLSEKNLSKANWSGTGLTRANLSFADLSGVDFSFADLSGADFSFADLSGADFSRANLSGVDLSSANLSEANLSRANLSGANLSGANLSGANLSEADLSEANLLGINLLGINLSGANLSGANLSGANLSGINLSGINLSGINLSGTNFSEATLSRVNLELANLENANLIKTILLEANLLSANLTGANLTDTCIKDWHINENTRLDDVLCDCIFLGYDYETKQPKDRRPASGSFAPGEFAVLLQRIQETIDLVFLNGIDWKAFAASFFNVQSESGGGELSIQAIEKKKDGAFVIRVTVPEGADKADIEKHLKQEYEWQLKALTEQYQFQLHAKENEIAIYRQQSANFFQIIEWLSKRPTIIENKAESHLMSGNQEFNLDRPQFGGGLIGTNYGTQTGGTINNYGQQQDLAAAAAEIQKILDQLSQQYPTTTIVEQAIVAEKAVQQVAANPQLQSRVIGAIKGAGTEAFKQAVNHYLVTIFVEGVKGWSEAK